MSITSLLFENCRQTIGFCCSKRLLGENHKVGQCRIVALNALQKGIARFESASGTPS
jgi:hypothetical protein